MTVARRARARRRGAPRDRRRRRRRDEPRGAQGLGAPVRRAPPWPSARTRVRPIVREEPPRAARRQRDHGEPRATAAACRTPTRSAACRRSTARRATRSRSRATCSTREVNSVTDNPTRLRRRDGERRSDLGRQLPRPALALALDFAAIAAAELANISERRVEQLVNPALSTGLTPFLAPRTAACTRAS